MSRFALVVQHHAADTPGAVARELRRAGIDVRDVRGFAGEAVPESIGGASGLVVMGAPFSVDDVDARPYLGAERSLIDSAIRAGVPVLGICFGAQLLACVLGGRVARDAAREIGWHSVELDALADTDPLFEALPSALVPFHWHSDAIVLPPGATRLARSGVTEVQAYRALARESGVYGLQFHLESDAGMIETMVSSFGDELRERGIDGAKVLEETRARLPEQERLARILFGRWAETVARFAR